MLASLCLPPYFPGVQCFYLIVWCEDSENEQETAEFCQWFVQTSWSWESYGTIVVQDA